FIETSSIGCRMDAFLNRKRVEDTQQLRRCHWIRWSKFRFGKLSKKLRQFDRDISFEWRDDWLRGFWHDRRGTFQFGAHDSKKYQCGAEKHAAAQPFAHDHPRGKHGENRFETDENRSVSG